MNSIAQTALVSLISMLPLLSGCAASASPTTETLRPPQSIDDYAWLAGTWRGEGLGGHCEESWSPPMAGEMVGTFRLTRQGKTVFFEMLVLHQDEAGFAMKVKHFSPDFAAWEERDESIRFAAEGVASQRADFDGLRVARVGDRLRAEVRMGDGAGEVRWEPFDLLRLP